jgi:hypothetical protein
MKSFMDVDFVPTIPHLIEEVPNFKAFIEGSLLDGDESLTSHTKVQQFKFYLNSSSVPMMKYKKYITDSDWLPKEGEGIKLWREDLEGESLWPCGEPMPIAHLPMRSMEDIYKGLSDFIKYWETLCDEDGSSEYQRQFEHLVFYWQAMNAALKETIEPSTTLRDGFWPSSQVQAIEEDDVDENGEVREEFGEDDVFVGQLRDRPLPTFCVACDVYEGYFLALRPADGDSKPIWIARALSNPFSNPKQPNCILIQYFRPMSCG